MGMCIFTDCTSTRWQPPFSLKVSCLFLKLFTGGALNIFWLMYLLNREATLMYAATQSFNANSKKMGDAPVCCPVASFYSSMATHIGDSLHRSFPILAAINIWDASQCRDTKNSMPLLFFNFLDILGLNINRSTDSSSGHSCKHTVLYCKCLQFSKWR